MSRTTGSKNKKKTTRKKVVKKKIPILSGDVQWIDTSIEKTRATISSNMHSLEQTQENVRKYGEKEDDTIARAYRHSKEAGDVYCAFNAQKYITRFISKSAKANNNVDLKKSIDYLERMILNNSDKKEVIEK